MTRLLLAIALAVLAASSAAAQAPTQNQCAECHSSSPRVRGFGHVRDWEMSAHKPAGIGCERCHGGNPTSSSVVAAHMGTMTPSNTKSPVSRQHISSTCGTCHRGPYAEFQKSRHNALLTAGDARGPTCVTCHGSTAALLLSPDAVAGECAQCHGTGKRAPHPERPVEARRLLEGVRDLRAQLDAAKRAIDGVRDPARQRQLRDAYTQAEAPLVQAVVAGHAFVFADSDARLALARRRVASLDASIKGGTGQ